MITLQNSNEFTLDKISLENDSVSSLLIPEYLMKDFLSKTEKFNGNVTFYLSSLLRRLKTITHTGLLPEPNKIKTEYQAEKLNLKKINFRPRNKDWVELGELALAFGKSRCWLFVYLLKLDLLGLWKVLVEAKMNKVVPTLPNLELQAFVKSQRVMDNFSRGFYVRV